MAQKKGQTGNPNGRPKGIPNKLNADTKAWLAKLLDKNRRQFEKDLKRLEPHQRVAIFEKLLAYSVPKMQAVQAKIDFGSLSDEQLDLICNELTKDLNDDTD